MQTVALIFLYLFIENETDIKFDLTVLAQKR